MGSRRNEKRQKKRCKVGDQLKVEKKQEKMKTWCLQICGGLICYLLEVVSSYCNLLVVAKGLMVVVSGCGIWSCYFKYTMWRLFELVLNLLARRTISKHGSFSNKPWGQLKTKKWSKKNCKPSVEWMLHWLNLLLKLARKHNIEKLFFQRAFVRFLKAQR